MFTAPALDSIEAQPPSLCVQPPPAGSNLSEVAERRPAGRRPRYGPLGGPVNSPPRPPARPVLAPAAEAPRS